MTPSHRTDLLTDIFLHYGRRKKESMRMPTSICCVPNCPICRFHVTESMYCYCFLKSDSSLADRMTKIITEKTACEEELHKVLQGYGSEYGVVFCSCFFQSNWNQYVEVLTFCLLVKLFV